MKGRAIVYLRQSSAMQEFSLAQQLEWAINIAKKLGITFRPCKRDLTRAVEEQRSEIGDLFLDDAMTGADMNRPGFLAMIGRALNDSQVSHVLFYARDRFARPEDNTEAMRLETGILEAGKHIVTSTSHSVPIDPLDLDAKVAFQAQQLFEYHAAGRFRKNLALRVLRGLTQNAKQGYWNGGHAPYGFRRVLVDTTTGKEVRTLRDKERDKRPGHKVVAVPGGSEDDKARLVIVLRIAMDYSNDMGGLSAIAQRLNAEGIPSPDAGRTRDGKPVSGKWSVGTVRSILEQPLYTGLTCWARHAEGSAFRYDDSPGCARPLEEWEKQPDGGNGPARKTVKREREDWVTAPSPVAYEPIVPPHVWLANYVKLRDRGSQGQGRRGVRRCTDPNKYPLPVTCGSCGMVMHGMRKNGARRYVCSTYMNSNGQQCAHNWIERDQAVAFVINAIRKQILASGQMDGLRRAVREVLCKRAKSRPKAASEATDLEHRLADLTRERKQAYRDKTKAKDPMVRADAADAYEQICREHRSLFTKLKAPKTHLLEMPTDIDAETEACLSLLDRLDLFLKKVPDNKLRTTFNALGVRLTVNFEKAEKGRRHNVPVGGTLEFGVNGRVDAAAVLNAQETESPPVRRTSGRRKKAAVAKKRQPTRRPKNTPAAASAEVLGVKYRGDWI